MIDEDLKELFTYSLIEAEPVYSLAECIAAEEDRRGTEFEADEDCEDCTNPVEAIKERFRTAVYLCDERQLDFLRLAADLSEKKSPWETDLKYHPFRVFSYNDFVYLFLHDDKYYLVLPNELLEIYHEVIAEHDFAEKNARKLELSDYAAALTNLYGAFEFDQFVAVWNTHHKDKITKKEAMLFLSDRAYFESDFYFYDDFLVNDRLSDDEFEDLWAETEGVPYYMPTKRVIREYAHTGYDDSKIPGQQEMDDFLAEYIADERDLEDTKLKF